jgi:hypothetical protein
MSADSSQLRLLVVPRLALQAVLVCAAAAGLVPLLLVDFPHRTPARKYFLHVTRPADKSAAAAAISAAAAAAAAAPECPLSWHIGGTCSLWHKQQQQRQQPAAAQQQQQSIGTAATGTAQSSAATGSEAACHDVASAWMQQQQQQQHMHQLQELQHVVCGVDAWVRTFHVKHSKKLLRLMWRAALDSNTVSIPQQQQQQQLGNSTNNAQPAGGAEQRDSNDWMKAVLQVELPASLLCTSVCSRSSSAGIRQDGLPAVPAAARQLNCYGNSLLVSCVGRAADLAAAAAADITADAATADVAVDHASSQGLDAAAAAAHSVAKQLASALAAALQCQHIQQQQQQGAEQVQQQQQQQGGEQVQVAVLSAEWLSAADVTPQQRPTPQQQQSKRARKARKQLMQAALVPLPCNPAQQQQQQQQDACDAADNCGCSSSSWMRLDVAIGFAPHLVYSASLPGWRPAPQQQQQQQGQVSAGIDSSSSAAAALLNGLRTVRASHAGLGVYGALLVVHGREDRQAGGLQLLLGCYGKQ